MAARDPEPFRASYRAKIDPRYRPLLHVAFVFLGGLGVVGFELARVESVGVGTVVAFVAGLCAFNLGVYGIHRGLGHRKRGFAKLFYERHTVEHHSFFLEHSLAYEELRDFRVILFPPWLLVIVSVVALGAGALVGGDAGRAFTAALVSGYLLYELFHLCHHLPDTHPIARAPWFRHMRHLHRLHHRRANMGSYNFNIVLPIADVLFGTLRWEPIARDAAPEA